jgi:hypothetical protein
MIIDGKPYIKLMVCSQVKLFLQGFENGNCLKKVDNVRNYSR